MNLTNKGNELLFINFNQDFRYCGALLFQDTMYSLAHGLKEGAWTNFFSSMPMFLFIQLHFCRNKARIQNIQLRSLWQMLLKM